MDPRRRYGPFPKQRRIAINRPHPDGLQGLGSRPEVQAGYTPGWVDCQLNATVVLKSGWEARQIVVVPL